MMCGLKLLHYGNAVASIVVTSPISEHQISGGDSVNHGCLYDSVLKPSAARQRKIGDNTRLGITGFLVTDKRMWEIQAWKLSCARFVDHLTVILSFAVRIWTAFWLRKDWRTAIR